MVDKIDEVIRQAMEVMGEESQSEDAQHDSPHHPTRKPLTQAKVSTDKEPVKRVYVPQIQGGKTLKPDAWFGGVKDIFPGIDSRTIDGMELNYGYCQICVDLGGEDHLSFIQKTLAKQLSFMSLVAGRLAVRAMEDETLLPTQQMVMRTMFTGMKMLGLERLPKEIEEISLATYLKESQ